MDIKELLGEIWRISKEIVRAERRSDNLSESALKATSTISAVRYGGTQNHCKHEHSVLEQTAIDSDMADIQAELRMLRRKLEPYVNLMHGGHLRAAVKMRYLEGLSVESTARRLGYERRYMYKLLDKAESVLIQLEKKTQRDTRICDIM